MSPHERHDVTGLDGELQRGVAVPLELLARDGDPHPEPLDVPEYLHCLSKVWIAVVSETLSAEVFTGDLAERPAGAAAIR